VNAGVSPSDFAQLCVADVMAIDPVVVRVDDTLETADRLLAAFSVSGLPVVDPDGNLVGVISRTDLAAPGERSVEKILRGNRSGLRVGELMSSPAVTVPITASLVEAARRMHERRIHRVVAVDDAGRPVGVVSASDFVTVVAEG